MGKPALNDRECSNIYIWERRSNTYLGMQKIIIGNSATKYA